jgi:deferrochelatase/peroxidase EfeB
MNSRKIVRYWLNRCGAGFHPDNIGKDYTTFTAEEIDQYDSDMSLLFTICADPYALAVEIMKNR